jgi:hypothetical protein
LETTNKLIKRIVAKSQHQPLSRTIAVKKVKELVRSDGAEVRKERLKKIAQFIQKALYNSEDGWILLKKTVAHLMFEFGLTEKRLIEYLKILQNMDRFELDFENNKIKSVQG